MHRLKSILVVLAVVSLGAATVAFAKGDDGRGDRGRGQADGDRGSSARVATATLRNAAGERVGEVRFKERGRGGTVEVYGSAEGLAPGFHGFHVHQTGQCVAPFTTAGGHYNPDGATHRNHAGDMPSLLINADSAGFVGFETDRFSLSDLRDADGSAVIVHELSDNYANIPTRYRSPDSPPQGGPDAATLATGDAGSRVACGVVE